MAWAGMNFVGFSKMAKNGRTDTEGLSTSEYTRKQRSTHIEHILLWEDKQQEGSGEP